MHSETAGVLPSAHMARMGVDRLVLLGGIILLGACAIIPFRRPASDFLQFYTGGKLLGSNLYSTSRALEVECSVAPGLRDMPDEVRAVLRPPVVYVPFWLVAKLSYRSALLLWTAFMLSALFGFLRLWPVRFEAAMQYSLFFLPLLIAFSEGQDAALLLFVLAAVGRLKEQSREVLSGLALSVFFFAKPSTLLMTPLAAIAFRSWRFAGGLIGGGASLYLLSAIILHDVLWPIAYLRHIAAQAHSSPAPLAIAAVALVLAAWCWRQPDPHVALAVLACGGLLCSPRALYYDLAAATLPLAILLLAQSSKKAATWLWLYALAAMGAWTMASYWGVRLAVAALLVHGLLLFGLNGRSPSNRGLVLA